MGIEAKNKEKKRVFARLLAQEFEIIKAGHSGTGTLQSTDGGKDVSNLSWDHDHVPPE